MDTASGPNANPFLYDGEQLRIFVFVVGVVLITAFSIFFAKVLVLVNDRRKRGFKFAWLTWNDPYLHVVSTAEMDSVECFFGQDIVGRVCMNHALCYVHGNEISIREYDLAINFVERLNSPTNKHTTTSIYKFHEDSIGVLVSPHFDCADVQFSKVTSGANGTIVALMYTVTEVPRPSAKSVSTHKNKCMYIGFVNTRIGPVTSSRTPLNEEVYGTNAYAEKHFVDACDKFVRHIKNDVEKMVKENSNGNNTVRLYGQFDGAGLAALTSVALTTGLKDSNLEVVLYTEGCPRIMSVDASKVFAERMVQSSPHVTAKVRMRPVHDGKQLLYPYREIPCGKFRVWNILSKDDVMPHIAPEESVFHARPIFLDAFIEEARQWYFEDADLKKDGFVTTVTTTTKDICVFLFKAIFAFPWNDTHKRRVLYDRIFTQTFCTGDFTRLQYLMLLGAFISEAPPINLYNPQNRFKVEGGEVKEEEEEEEEEETTGGEGSAPGVISEVEVQEVAQHVLMQNAIDQEADAVEGAASGFSADQVDNVPPVTTENVDGVYSKDHECAAAQEGEDVGAETELSVEENLRFLKDILKTVPLRPGVSRLAFMVSNGVTTYTQDKWGVPASGMSTTSSDEDDSTD